MTAAAGDAYDLTMRNEHRTDAEGLFVVHLARGTIPLFIYKNGIGTDKNNRRKRVNYISFSPRRVYNNKNSS